MGDEYEKCSSPFFLLFFCPSVIFSIFSRLTKCNSRRLEEEFISLIQEHEGILHKVIGLYTNSKEEGKDLYQEMLLQSWKSYANFRKASRFSTWLYRICLNTALTYRKKENTWKSTALNLEAGTDIAVDPKEQEHELLYLLIKRLNEVDKMLITLHLDGYKNPEIAEITGMTTNHVNVKIHRIKTTIIDQFKKESDGHI